MYIPHTVPEKEFSDIGQKLLDTLAIFPLGDSPAEFARCLQDRMEILEMLIAITINNMVVAGRKQEFAKIFAEAIVSRFDGDYTVQ